jgi:hypothetical protein
MLHKVLLNLLFGFEDVDRKNDQSFPAEFLGDVVDELCFRLAVFAPRGPELEQDDFALDGIVIELFAGRGLGAEAGGGLSRLVASPGKERDQQ